MLLSAGQLDTTFGSGGTRLFDTGFDFPLRDAVLDSTGRIVVLFAGNTSAVQRFTPNGANDPTFTLVTSSGLGPLQQLDAIAVQSDNKIIVAGNTATGDVSVTRYLVNGNIDSSFGVNGTAFIPSAGNGLFNVTDIAVRPDNRILIGGSVSADFMLIGLTAEGQPDANFGGLGSPVVKTDVAGDEDEIKAIALLPDGRIAVSGLEGGNVAVAMYQSNGAPDNGFSGDGKLVAGLLSQNASSHLTISLGNRITMLDPTFGGAADQVAVVRFDAQGSLDASFSSDGISAPLNSGPIGTLFDGVIAVDAVGQIVIAYDSFKAPADIAQLVRLNPDGTVDGSFVDPGVFGSAGFAGTSDRLLIGPNNTIIIATSITNNDLAMARFEGTHPPKPVLTSFLASTVANSLTVRLRYEGEAAIDPSSVAFGNVRLGGPNNFNQPPTSFSTATPSGNTLTVDYVFPAPGGTVDASDAGAYQLIFQSTGVSDGNGNSIQPAIIDLNLNIGNGLTDLAFSNTTFNPGLYFPSDNIAAALTVTATGGSVASFDLQIVLSLDKIAGNADDITLLDTIVTTSSTTITSLGPIPEDAAPDDYFLIARLDPDGEVSELDEANNVLMSKEPSIHLRPPTFNPPPKGIGQPDSAFGTDGRIRPVLGFASTGGLIEQPDGSLLIAGSLGGSGDKDVGIARRTSTGDRDTTFGGGAGLIGADLRGTDDRVTDIALLSGGQILVAGTSADPGGGGSDFFVMRRTENGSNDNAFGTNGRTFIDFDQSPLQGPPTQDVAQDMLVDPQGRILVVGRTDLGSSVNFAIARLTSGGQLDTSFGIGGRMVTDFAGGLDAAKAVALTASGSIVVTGFATVGSTRVVAVAQYTSDGVLDTSFGTGGLATATTGNPDDRASAIAISSTGQIVVAGFTSGGTVGAGNFFSQFLVARFTSKGKLDKKFGNQGVATKDVGSPARATYVEILADGRVIASGVASSTIAQGVAGAFDIAIARFTSGGDADASFNDTGSVVIETGNTTSALAPAGNTIFAEGSNLPLATTDDTIADFQESAEAKLIGRSGGGAYIAGTNGTETVVVAITTSGIELSGEVISTVPASIIGGGKGSLKVNVANLGDVYAEGAIDITFYASSDIELGSGDLQFHQISAATVKLKPLSLNGKAKKFTAKFTYPSNLPDGTYFLLAVVDAGTITDLSADNNTAFTSTDIQITAPVLDLTGPSVAGDITFVTGKKASIPVALVNEGNVDLGTTTLSLVFVFSTDDTFDESDITRSTASIKASLKAGRSKLLNVKLLSPTLDPGTYFLFVIVDSTNAVSEMNEANNLLSSTLSSTLQ